MKKGFYPKIAFEGIKKNRRIYFPYILTGTVMVMMVYIMFFLARIEALKHISGGGSLQLALPLGGYVISVFSLLFMFYSNSFTIRQRNKEFGLYNILGMNKSNLRKIAFWEVLFTGCFSVAVGLTLGIVFSKLAELLMYNLLIEDITYTLRVDFVAIAKTAIIFAGIYFVLYINSLIRVSKSSPLQLLHSANVGEKQPKANWFFAVAGVVILAAAYYIAVSIKQPLLAFVLFMIAVIMVIIATYLLFISGSVAFCRLLKKNKKYYYKPNHFVSVASMVYRMKRNGAGLASICVLITMVLVMLSATFSLYIGAEDSLNSRYPTDIQLKLFISKPEYLNETTFKKIRSGLDSIVPKKENAVEYSAAETSGLFTDSGIIINDASVNNMSILDYENVGYLQIITLEDYNRLMGTNEKLSADECILQCHRTKYSGDTFTIENCSPLKVKSISDEMFIQDGADMQVMPIITLVTADINALVKPISSMKNSDGFSVLDCCWSYNFDVNGTPEEEIAVRDAIEENLESIAFHYEDGSYGYRLDCKEANRAEFYGSYAGLLFIGVLLSIVFMFAAVLIIYYKQISEGYEDQRRFDVMQKVGMTKKNIRKSINSQVLTVFFMPLILAGVHLAFAFPIVWKILQLFSFSNLGLMIFVTAMCFTVFALVYAVVYKITSNTYYAIVSNAKD